MQKQKVIFHIDELNKWNLLLKNVSNLLDAVDINNFSIEVLANSEAVKAYIVNNELDLNISYAIERLNHKCVKFVACNNALKAYNIQKDYLMHFIEIVPVGVLELINRQGEGYSYIKP